MRNRSFWFVLVCVSGLMMACYYGALGYYGPIGYQKTNNLLTGDSYEFARKDERGQYVEYPLRNIDIKSFKILDENTYASDNFHVYFEGITMEGADPASFSLLSADQARDNVHVYYRGAIIPGAAPKSFKSLDAEWGKDSHAAYYHLQPFKVCDPETFGFIWEPGTSVWESDAQCVYSNGSKLPGADPASFVALSLWFGKDKTHVYYADKIIQGADPATFRVKGTSAYSPDSIMGQDKNGCYFQDEAQTCH